MNCVLAASVMGMPFDVPAALLVGAIVVVAAAVVLTVAILTPFIAIQAGTTLLLTAVAVAGISLATGLIGGVAAGFVKGGEIEERNGEIRIEWIKQIRRVGGQLDVYFQPGDDPKKAADFRCVLVSYDETNPDRPVLEQHVAEQSSEGFYEQIGSQLDKWLNRRTATDAGQGRREMKVFMVPFPGNGVYERLRELCSQRGGITITRVEGPWTSALPAN